MADDNGTQDGGQGSPQQTAAERARSTVASLGSSVMSWFSSSSSSSADTPAALIDGGGGGGGAAAAAAAAVPDSAGSDSGDAWWSKVISREALGSVSKRATDFIRERLAAHVGGGGGGGGGGCGGDGGGGGGGGRRLRRVDSDAGLLSPEEMDRRRRSGERVSSEQGGFALEDGDVGLDGDDAATADGDGADIPASLATLLTASPGSARAEKAELEHWLLAHDCGAACDAAELLVSRGVNLAKLRELAPEMLARSLPFIGLGHRCLLQHTLARYNDCALNENCLSTFDELLEKEAKFAADLLTLRDLWAQFPPTLDLHLYTSVTGRCPRTKDELCKLYNLMYTFAAAFVDALQTLRAAGRSGGSTADEVNRDGAQGEDEPDTVKANDFLRLLEHHIPFKSAGGFTYSALFESLNEFIKTLEHPASGDSRPKGKLKATSKQKADIKLARQLVAKFNTARGQIPAPPLSSLLIAPVQTFFHTRNLVVKLFDDLSKDKWVNERVKNKVQVVLNKCTEMLSKIDQDCDVPVHGTFFVSPEERRGFRKARFVFNRDYVCWALNDKMYQRSWSEFTVSLTEETERIRFTNRSGATGDDVFIICKPLDRRGVWFRTIRGFEEEYHRKVRTLNEQRRLSAETRLGGGTK